MGHTQWMGVAVYCQLATHLHSAVPGQLPETSAGYELPTWEKCSHIIRPHKVGEAGTANEVTIPIDFMLSTRSLSRWLDNKTRTLFLSKCNP